MQTYNGAVTAIATVFIAIFTIVLASVSGRQAKLTRQAVELANKEYVSTHRPRLILRDAILEAENVIYLLLNVGDTKATIVESWILVEFVEDGTRMRPIRSFGHDDLKKLVLKGGESKELTYPIPNEVSFAIRWPEAIRIGIEDKPGLIGKTYFVGALVYEDDLGVKRRTIFRRRWDPGSLVFVRLTPEEERDHEYAD